MTTEIERVQQRVLALEERLRALERVMDVLESRVRSMRDAQIDDNEHQQKRDT